MRILLDENLDWRLKRYFAAEHEVLAVRDTEFAGLQNGVLLRAAAESFDVLVTLDRNLQYQQNLPSIDLAIILIRTVHSRLRSIEPLMGGVNDALQDIRPGSVIVVAG